MPARARVDLSASAVTASDGGRRPVGTLPTASGASGGSLPARLAAATWLLFAASLAAAAVRPVVPEGAPGSSLVAVDGLTLVMWVAVTFFSGVVQSYSVRYLQGSRGRGRFSVLVLGFTSAVLVLVAADHVALFAAAWLGMGLFMAELIGHVRSWPQARAAASCARRHFLASSLLVAAGVAVLAWSTGEVTISGIGARPAAGPDSLLWTAAGLLVLAGAVQSALVPFHGWVLSSMTAPTPASALMHAGFVNAGGIVLVRFAPAIGLSKGLMAGVALLGAVSAVGGKLLKSVRPEVKGQLGCSTVGQMGFMFLQAGLGFYAAAVTHLVLHGFYKGYLFLSAGGRVEARPPDQEREEEPSSGPLVLGTSLLTAAAGGALFAVLTGKGLGPDAGLILTGLVVLTVGQATRDLARRERLPTAVRFVGGPGLFLALTLLYAGAYSLIEGLMGGVPVVTAAADLSEPHLVIVGLFLLGYLAVETGVHRASRRLYVTLLNAGRPRADSLLTSREEYRVS